MFKIYILCPCLLIETNLINFLFVLFCERLHFRDFKVLKCVLYVLVLMIVSCIFSEIHTIYIVFTTLVYCFLFSLNKKRSKCP